MPYVIKRTDQGGGYVCDTKVSGGNSYTQNIAKAKTFRTREQAEGDASGRPSMEKGA